MAGLRGPLDIPSKAITGATPTTFAYLQPQGDCTISHDPNSTFSRYSVFQAAVSRLFFIPTFAVFSFLRRLKAARRRMLKLASAFPFLIRHWSSPKVTSNCQCNLFSMLQWPRTAAPNDRALIFLLRM